MSSLHFRKSRLSFITLFQFSLSFELSTFSFVQKRQLQILIKIALDDITHDITTQCPLNEETSCIIAKDKKILRYNFKSKSTEFIHSMQHGFSCSVYIGDNRILLRNEDASHKEQMCYIVSGSNELQELKDVCIFKRYQASF